MSALRWMTGFNHVHIFGTGRVGNVCWLHAFAWNVGDPGRTPQYLVLERENGETRVVPDLTDAEHAAAKADPIAFWDRGRPT